MREEERRVDEVSPRVVLLLWFEMRLNKLFSGKATIILFYFLDKIILLILNNNSRFCNKTITSKHIDIFIY